MHVHTASNKRRHNSAHSTIGKLVGLSEAEIVESQPRTINGCQSGRGADFSRLLIEKHRAVFENGDCTARKGGPGEVAALTILNIFNHYFNTAFPGGRGFFQSPSCALKRRSK